MVTEKHPCAHEMRCGSAFPRRLPCHVHAADQEKRLAQIPCEIAHAMREVPERELAAAPGRVER